MDILEKVSEGEVLPLDKDMVRQEVTQVVDKNKAMDVTLVAGMVKRSNRILVTVSSHRLFDFFPDTMNVEEGRITIITRSFFLSSQVHSVDIKDISNIFINTAPFFAQLVIVSKTFAKNEIRIKYLWKDEAIYVRRMVEGLRVFETKQIDTSVFTLTDLREKLSQLSTTEIVV